ncbi:hypothetical protein ABH937_004703 [Kitasatospora sp. GAS1066B]
MPDGHLVLLPMYCRARAVSDASAKHQAASRVRLLEGKGRSGCETIKITTRPGPRPRRPPVHGGVTASYEVAAGWDGAAVPRCTGSTGFSTPPDPGAVAVGAVVVGRVVVGESVCSGADGVTGVRGGLVGVAAQVAPADDGDVLAVAGADDRPPPLEPQADSDAMIAAPATRACARLFI